LAYITDLNNITGDLSVSGNLTVEGVSRLSGDTWFAGDLTFGSGSVSGKQVQIYNDTQISNNLTVYRDLQVSGNITGKIDASSITSGILPHAKMPNLFMYGVPSAASIPNWCRIMTVNLITNRFIPFKFNILGSRNASGWGTWFDEDYYIQFRRDTTTADLSDTYYYYAHRKSNFPCGDLKLSFVKTSINVMDVYLYRDRGDFMNGSILFNISSNATITTYTNEPVLIEAPENSSFCPVRFMPVPTPPATGTLTLQSVNGALKWV
jgi:hypothetical protein